ncbi:MAG: DUF115 domain-containing protein [Treponema sp.]|nr:DUF115 domain-containing protein [Treponema sp.]
MNNAGFYVMNKSRTGEDVPAILLPCGNIQYLHSMIDPKKEAERLVSSAGDIGFAVILGLGGGFACEAVLKLTNAQVLVIDYGKNDIEKLFTQKDYSSLINNNRFTLLVDPSDEEIKNFILENFKPALCGNIKTIPLRSRIEYNKEKFEKAVSVIQESIAITSGDYSVQAHFGKRWFSNIIRNIKHSEENNKIFFNNKYFVSIKECVIAAAGPSLDSQLPLLKKLKKEGVFIISTDTALGSLFYTGIEPDVVVSIDCQYISLSHFTDIKFKSGQIPLILDIASPPALANLHSFTPVFFSSGHPLAVYSSENWRSMPLLDTTGGNVTYTCLSLAQILNIKKITFFGADFSYVNSQTYARGSYIYPYFLKKQNRLSPLEALHSSFLYRSPFLPKTENKNEKKINYYETKQLKFYREKLEEKVSVMDAQIIFAKGNGAPVNLTKINKTQENAICKNKQAAVNENDIKGLNGLEFLKQYRDNIAALPQGASESYLSILNKKEKQVFLTLLPFAAAVRKRNPELESGNLIEEIKYRSIKEIEQVLV